MVLSEVERVGIRKKEYFGLSMFCLTPEVQQKVNATFSISPTEKWTQEGFVTVDRHENSYRFKDEVVLTVWSRVPPKKLARAINDGYYRIEIPIPVAVAIQLFEKALERLWFLQKKEVSV